MMPDHDEDNPIDGKVLAGAAIHGIRDGFMSAMSEYAESGEKLASQLIAPGDQHHVPHPLDQFKNRMLWAAEWVMTPGDMNLKHSPHPIDTTVKAHAALINATADTLTEKGLVQGTRELSAIATAVLAENADPLKKLRAADKLTELAATTETLTKKTAIGWDDYAHLLGNGTQPPKLKPLRDFSDAMEFTLPAPRSPISWLSYQINEHHGIFISMEHSREKKTPYKLVHTSMEFAIKAEDAKLKYGSGAEMFHSAQKLLNKHGVKIDEIDVSWNGKGEFSSNYDAFVRALHEGETIKAALKKTYTGRWASDAGLTEVVLAKGNEDFFNYYGHKFNRFPSTISAKFTRPQFHPEHPSYNTYGQAWVGSQGRAHVELVPRYISKLDTQLPGTFA
jgi:hypothetical protein